MPTEKQFTVTVVKTIFMTAQISVTATDKDEAHDIAISEAKQDSTRSEMRQTWKRLGLDHEVVQILNERGSAL